MQVDDLQKWLQSLPTAKIKLRSCFSPMASCSDVTNLNEALQEWQARKSSSGAITVSLDTDELFRVRVVTTFLYLFVRMII